ncbi:(R,R)-butanediol dehydrogenase-like protein [Microdochium nivale]|nr:(R,R)-butanediol dehydrogenase-like protein [Microdochium nivale]
MPTMRALRYYAPQDLRLDTDVPEPECAPHEVKVRPAYIGICGTDLHEFQHAQNLIPLPGKPHPLTGGEPPIIIGHEFSGLVVEVGSAVTRHGNGGSLKVGDRVAVQPTLYCRECVPCRQGNTNCCTKNGFLGLSGRGGGLADFVCADADAVFKLPDSVPLEVGALVEPLTVAWHAISISGIKPGDNVLVLGTGPIGLAVIQCLPSFGVGQIIAAEMAGERQAFARRYGATHLVDPATEDVAERCLALLGTGYGPEIAFDCAGVEQSLDAATRAVRAKGTVVNLAIWHGKVGFDPNSLVFHEKTYKGSLCFLPSDFGKVIEAIEQGTIKPQDMITRKIALDRVVEDGFKALIHEKDKHVKIMIDMGLGEK